MEINNFTNAWESENIQSDLLDIDAATKLLGYKKGSMYQLTCKRLIPHYRVPGLRKVFFSKKELEEWILTPSNKMTTTQELAFLAIQKINQN